MKISIQAKLLALCVSLVLITAISISATYYTLSKHDKQREIQERIYIAFEVIRDDFTNRIALYPEKLNDFLQKESTTPWVTFSYHQEQQKYFSRLAALSHFSSAAEELYKFADAASADRLILYGSDKRLLIGYYRDGEQAHLGGYVLSETGNDTYLPMDDAKKLSEILMNKEPIADLPLPQLLAASYPGEIPDETQVTPLYGEQGFGFNISVPIIYQAQKVGVLVCDIFYTQHIVERYALLSKADVNIFSGNQFSVGTLPVEALLEDDDLEQSPDCQELFMNELPIGIVPMMLEEQQYYQGKCAFKNIAGEAVGAMTVSLSQEVEQQESRKILTSVIGVAVVISIIAIGFSLFASRTSVRFIQQLIHYIERIAKGEIPGQITGLYKGEFQEIQQNINSLIEAMDKATHLAEEIGNGNLTVDIEKRSEKDILMQALEMMVGSLREVATLAEKMADGDLTLEVVTRSGSDRLMQALDLMVTKLNNILLDVKATADHVATGSQEMREIAEHVSERNAQQAAAAEEASASMQEMVATIRQTAENAKMTEGIAVQSADDARQGGQAVANTIEAMKKIEKRISIIQEISIQTNILSMNATIEAAKAQDYGKGFAVVASEVRSLAQRSREAAEEIEQLVKSCVVISEQAGEILSRLVPNSEKTANLIQEINAASNEQYAGAEQVNNAIQQLDQVIQKNALTAEEMASSAEAFTSQIDQLRAAMTFFTVKERLEEQSTEGPSELMQALQTLINTEGANEEVLMAMLKTMLSSPKIHKTLDSGSDPPAELRKSSKKTGQAEQKDPIEQSEKFDGCEIELQAQKFQHVKDDKDDEFEKF